MILAMLVAAFALGWSARGARDNLWIIYGMFKDTSEQCSTCPKRKK